MDFNTIAMILGAAVFVLPVVYMLGYARHEKQHKGWVADSREGYHAERKAIFNKHQADLAACELAIQQERNVVRELEISLLKAGESLELIERQKQNETARADISSPYRKTLVQAMLDHGLWKFEHHAGDPCMMLKILCDHVAECAIDPAQNQKAKNLHTRGVRKGAKAGREQMRKLMQKCIDNQAATIRHYDVELTNANKRRMRFTEAVTNVLNDKIALPGVRRSLTQAIIQEHDRLRAVADKKGE